MISSSVLVKEFINNLIVRHWRKYAVVALVCLVYSFGIPLTGPKAYKAEAVLVFKERDDLSYFEDQRIAGQPVPIFIDETPFESQYDYDGIVYSNSIAREAIGDHFTELFDPKKYTGELDFYENFVSLLGYSYDGDYKTITLTYTYKDPELAAEFCNGFAYGLQNYVQRAVVLGSVSRLLETELARSREESEAAQEEMTRLASEYQIPDIIASPSEWLKNYAEAREQQALSQVKMQAALEAIHVLRQQRNRRDLLNAPESAPDTNILQDLILAGMRLRLDLMKVSLDLASEGVPPDSDTRTRLTTEINFLQNYLENQYKLGLDVEVNEVSLEFQKYHVEDFVQRERVEETYEKIARIPELERAIRPAIRRANLATSKVYLFEKLLNYFKIGEDYENIPLMVIDEAVVPYKPVITGWKTLGYLLPTMLFMCSIWIGLKESNYSDTGIETN